MKITDNKVEEMNQMLTERSTISPIPNLFSVKYRLWLLPRPIKKISSTKFTIISTLVRLRIFLEPTIGL
jgi:hypothetical protein